MATTTAPLLSFGARGTIAKTAVFSSWKGVPYVRRHVIPANPNTAGQQLTRSVFAWLMDTWKISGPLFQAVWTEAARGRPLTNRNLLAARNIASLRTASDLSTLVFSPGSAGGLAATSMTLTPGANSITVAITPPTPPTDWTLTSAVAACIRDQDPNTGSYFTMTEGSDETTPYSIDLTGLTSAVLYQVGAWLLWTKADGNPAYGASIIDSATPT